MSLVGAPTSRTCEEPSMMIRRNEASHNSWLRTGLEIGEPEANSDRIAAIAVGS